MIGKLHHIKTDEFSFEYFKNLCPANGKKLSAKAFLATKQRISANIVREDKLVGNME